MSTDARSYALRVIEALSAGRPAQTRDVDFVRKHCDVMCSIVELMVTSRIQKDSKVLLLGGDHSTPLGAIKATHNRKRIDTILHIDAHADMYEAYEGFAYSHASIMHNVRQMLPNVRMVHVGLRDVAMCESIAMTGDRLPTKPHPHVVYDNDILRKCRMENGTVKLALGNIVSELYGNTYISFDIDGLDPSLCPNTGTPVMGGLREDEYRYLFDLIGARIDAKLISLVGADLVEIAPASSEPETWEGDWDANVGMRVLYDLTKLLLR